MCFFIVYQNSLLCTFRSHELEITTLMRFVADTLPPSPKLLGCYLIRQSPILFGGYVMSTVFETGSSLRLCLLCFMLNAELVVFILTLHKAIKTCQFDLSHVPTQPDLTKLADSLNKYPIWQTLYRDGASSWLFYFYCSS